MEYLLQFKNVIKEYQVGDTVIKANDDLTFNIQDNEFCIIVGPSSFKFTWRYGLVN